MFSRSRPCFNGSRSSTFPEVSMKFRISPLSLIIRCNLNLKNHPMELFPRLASPSNVLWIVATNTQSCGVNKTDAGTCPQQNLFDENGQRKQHFLLQFHETAIRYLTRKQVFQVFAHIFLVIMLEAAETARVEQNEITIISASLIRLGLLRCLTFLFSITYFSCCNQIPCKNHRPYNKFP